MGTPPPDPEHRSPGDRSDAPPEAPRLGGGGDPLDDLVVLRPKERRPPRSTPAAPDAPPTADAPPRRGASPLGPLRRSPPAAASPSAAPSPEAPMPVAAPRPDGARGWSAPSAAAPPAPSKASDRDAGTPADADGFAVPQSVAPSPPPATPGPDARAVRRRERVRRLKRAGLLTTGAGLLGAGGVLGWVARDVLPGGDVGGTNVTLTRPVQIEAQPVASNTLPSVTGLGTDAAIQAYTDAGVDRQRITTEDVPYVGASGTVVRQNPAATAQIPGRGTPIVLSIARQATMPALVGTPSDDARSALADLGVGVTTVTEYQQGAKPGTVIRSRPPAAERAQTQATLVVSEVASSIGLSELEPAGSDGCAPEDAGGQEVIACAPQDGRASIEYPSNGKVTALRGTIALGPDATVSRARVLIREVGAGGVGVRTRKTITVTGAGARFEAVLKGGSTLRIEALPGTGEDDAVQVRISGAQLVGARSGIDALDKATP